MNIFRQLLKLVWRPKPCKHLHHEAARWLDTDKTPIILVRCADCGKTLDKGHVYADSSTWLKDEEAK